MDRTAFPRRAGGLLAGTAAAALLGTLLPLSAAAAVAPTPAVAASASPSPSATRAPRLPALPAPGLDGPNETATVLKDVVLDWQAVEGATVYDVQVGTDENWADTPTFAVRTLSTQATLPAWLPQASYVWRVAAARAGGSGRWSANGSFTRGWRDRPTPLTPGPDAVVPAAPGAVAGTMPEFSWTPVAGASAYEVQVSTTPSFDEHQGPTTAPRVDSDPTQDQVLPDVDTCFTTHTRVTPFTQHTQAVGEDHAGDCVSTLLLGSSEPRFWRVRALDRFADETVEAVDTTPASDEGVSHLPPSDEPLEDVVSACPGAPTTPATPSASPSASPSGSATPAPTRAPGVVGCERTHPAEQSAWSPAVRFRLARDPQAVEADFRALPAVRTDDLRQGNPCTMPRAQHVCTDVPTLRWGAVRGATAYRVYVSLTPTYSNLRLVADTTGLSFTPTDSWRDSTAGSAFYYAVQPCTVEGCGVVTSAPPSFRKTSPAVVLGAPAADALLRAGDVVLSWGRFSDALRARNTADGAAHTDPTSEATGYRLQVTTADDPDFRGEPLEDVTVDGTTYATPDVAYGDGAFLWRVQPVDGSGHALPWSAARAFTRDATRATVSAAPAVLAVDGTVRLRFSEPVGGVTSTSVHLSAVRPDGTTDRVTEVPGRVTVVGETEVVLKPVAPLVAGRRYQLVVEPSVRDLAGNSAVAEGPVAAVAARMDDGSPALRYTAGWRYRSATDAVGGGFRTSSPTMRAQSAVSTSVYGRGVVVTGCVGPAGGLADLWVDGSKRARVDTYRAFSGCGVRLAQWTGTLGVHRVQLRGVGLKRAASRGTAVAVDAVVARP